MTVVSDFGPVSLNELREAMIDELDSPIYAPHRLQRVTAFFQDLRNVVFIKEAKELSNLGRPHFTWRQFVINQRDYLSTNDIEKLQFDR